MGGHLAQATLSSFVLLLPAFSLAALVAFPKSHQLKPAPSHDGFHYQDPERRITLCHLNFRDTANSLGKTL